MITLAIETSGRVGSVALAIDGVVQNQRELSATGRRHARTLVPEIDSLLKEQSVCVQNVDLVAVSKGPGSFTGLRVGIVCAKTMAYAIGARIVGVDTFHAVASVQPAARVWVIEDALRGDIFAGEYCFENGLWTCLQTPRLWAFEVWNQQLDGTEWVCGPGINLYQDQLVIPFQTDLQKNIPQASEIAILGTARGRVNDVDDHWTLEPFYMRRSAAEEKADAQQQS